MLTKEEIDNLSELLLSANDENAEIALAILSGQEEPIKELLTDVFAVYKITRNKTIKEQAIQFLSRLELDEKSQLLQIKKLLKADKNITEEHIKKRIFTYVRASKGVLDGVKLAIILFKKYKIGMTYIWENAVLEQQQFFLRYFIRGTTISMIELKLSTIPNVLYTFENLTLIDLSKNQLSFIPSKFEKFSKLQELNLSHNKITDISSQITSLKYLFRLNISHNSIKILPNELLECNRMKELDLQGNRLSSLPNEFTKLDKLEKLWLSHNSFEEFPQCITKLKNLKSLSISFDSLEIPSMIGELENLEELILRLPHHTYLLEIPDSYKQLKKLKKIEFCKWFTYRNRFSSSPQKTLGEQYKQKFEMILPPNCQIS